MRGTPVPKETEFRTLEAGVQTTSEVFSRPLNLKRISKASTLLEGVHGTQGNFENRCKVVSTMVNAIGLHASEIVPIDLKSVRPFETKIMCTILGNSRLGRAKEIVFSILYAGRRISPLLHTPHAKVLKPKAGWWEWAVLGSTDTPQLTGGLQTRQAQHTGIATLPTDHSTYCTQTRTVRSHALPHKQPAHQCQHYIFYVGARVRTPTHTLGSGALHNSLSVPTGTHYVATLPLLQSHR